MGTFRTAFPCHVRFRNKTNAGKFKCKAQFWKRPSLKNEMEVLFTSHVKEYVLTNT